MGRECLEGLKLFKLFPVDAGGFLTMQQFWQKA